MSRGPLRFKETDVRRFLRAFTKEGLPVAEVMVDSDGNLTAVIPCPPSSGVVGVTAGESVQANPWDGVSEQGTSTVPRA